MMKSGQTKVNQEIPAIFLFKRLWIPLSSFFFFLIVIFSSEELLNRFLGNASIIVRNMVEYGTQIGLWFSTAFLVQRLITVFIWDGFISGISGRPVPRLPKDVTALCIFGISVVGVLATVFDQSVTGIWATSGALSVVIGIALRNVILDVFIGLSMHIEKSFQIGDWVMVHQNRRENHIVGQVFEINWRTTRLKTTAKNMIVVPNSRMGEAILTNYMEPQPHFRIELNFVLDYSITPDRAIRVLMSGVQALVDNEKILSEPAPEVRLEEAQSFGQKYEVRFFILPVHISPKESKHVVNKSIIEHLARAGLSPSMEKEMIFWKDGKNYPLIPSMSEENFDIVLGKSKLFEFLNEEDRELLSRKISVKNLKAGEVLYRQGNVGDSFYFLAEGLLCSSIELSEMGSKAKIERLESGTHFGEEGVLKKGSRLSTISALTDSIIFVFDYDLISSLAARNGKFLSLLNEKMVLGQDKIIKTKWRIQKEGESLPETSQKSGMGQTIQTFFSDFFPNPSNTASKK